MNNNQERMFVNVSEVMNINPYIDPKSIIFTGEYIEDKNIRIDVELCEEITKCKVNSKDHFFLFDLPLEERMKDYMDFIYKVLNDPNIKPILSYIVKVKRTHQSFEIEIKRQYKHKSIIIAIDPYLSDYPNISIFVECTKDTKFVYFISSYKALNEHIEKAMLFIDDQVNKEAKNLLLAFNQIKEILKKYDVTISADMYDYEDCSLHINAKDVPWSLVFGENGFDDQSYIDSNTELKEHNWQ